MCYSTKIQTFSPTKHTLSLNNHSFKKKSLKFLQKKSLKNRQVKIACLLCSHNGSRLQVYEGQNLRELLSLHGHSQFAPYRAQ